MATYAVTGVRRERSADRSHEHLEGVCAGGAHYTRKEVIDSISAGDVWEVSVGGRTAVVTPLAYCPAPGCLAAPYLHADPDDTGDDQLEALPSC
jgi:hypothetical protein